MHLSRRALLQGAAAGLLPWGAGADAAETAGSLRALAQRQGLFYGTAVSSDRLASDKPFAALVAQQAGMLVAEGETKRKALEPSPGRFAFAGPDAILDFATAHGQRMRGHTLAWYQGNPDWLTDKIRHEAVGEAILTDYVDTVVRHYRGRFTSWDVVNEAIAPDQGEENGLRRDNIWYEAFGERYIDLAFHAARAADPTARLYLNELNAEADIWWSADVRVGTLNLIDRLLKRNVPLDGFGMQGHLKAFKVSYSDEIISRFLDEISARGLDIIITEFDVADIAGPDDDRVRDAQVASLAKRFLDVAFSKPRVKGCLTWGISNKYSWLSHYPQYQWADGRLSRGLPFDETFRPTPLEGAIAAALRAAPKRPG